MSKRPIYKKVRRTLHETVSDSGKSILSYRGNDDKIYYVASSNDPNVEPGGGGSGITILDSIDELPTAPTPAEQKALYLIGTKLYNYAGTGGDTLDGKYQSTELKGADGAPGAPGPKGDSGVDLGEAVLINDLTTGGATNVLSAEMGKELNTYVEGSQGENITYPYNNVVGTGNAISLAGYAVMMNIPVSASGQLTALRFKRLDAAGNAKIIILDADKNVVSNTTIAVSSTSTDLASYNLNVDAGQYIAVAAIKNGASGDIRTLAATGVEYGYFPGDKAVGAASGYTANGSKKLDFEIDISSEAVEGVTTKEKIADNDARITALEEAQNNPWLTRKLLHIGTSVSDYNTTNKCYWFNKAMELIGCPSANWHNSAKSGQNARYFAQNYDTLIAPYIADCYLFTIELGINDRTVITTDDVAKMQPDLETYPDTLGFDIVNSYYGAMAYIITRARSENMGIKIAIIGHWREGTDNWAAIDPCITGQVNVSEEMDVPLLRLWDFMGATAQEVTWSGEIYGTAYSGTKTIRQWYSTCPPSWNGDGLHPFNPIAQEKYASIYTGWVQSW